MIQKYRFDAPIPSAANLREHWAAKHRRVANHRLWAKLTVDYHPVPLKVRLTRIGPQPLDDDNLRAAFKGIRDGIADALEVPDNHPGIVWEYAQRKGRPAKRKPRPVPAEQAAEIEVIPLDEGEVSA